MGCASSRLEGSEGGGCPMPFKARPALRLDDTKIINSQTPTHTLSKKKLLHEEEDDQDHARMKKRLSFDQENESCVTSEGGGGGVRNDKLDGNSGSGAESDDDQYAQERMVRRKDDHSGGFPGSPSFRVYFNDTTNNLQEINKLGSGEDMVIQEEDMAAKIDDAQEVQQPVPVLVEVESPVISREEKKHKRRGSFKKVLPNVRGGQAAMKNLLNVRSCMPSPHSTSHDHHNHRLLTPKTTPAA